LTNFLYIISYFKGSKSRQNNNPLQPIAAIPGRLHDAYPKGSTRARTQQRVPQAEHRRSHAAARQGSKQPNQLQTVKKAARWSDTRASECGAPTGRAQSHVCDCDSESKGMKSADILNMHHWQALYPIGGSKTRPHSGQGGGCGRAEHALEQKQPSVRI